MNKNKSHPRAASEKKKKKSYKKPSMNSEKLSDKEALAAFHTLTRCEGIIPALESSHAVSYAMKLAAGMDPKQIILVNLSGRGDKDMHTVAALDGSSTPST